MADIFFPNLNIESIEIMMNIDEISWSKYNGQKLQKAGK